MQVLLTDKLYNIIFQRSHLWYKFHIQIHPEICIRTNRNVSESIKKNSNLVWCKSIKNQSDLVQVYSRFLIPTKSQLDSIWVNPSLPIWMNSNEVLNPNEAEVRMI